MQNVTIIVKTMLRPASLERLLRSIRHFYANVPILIGDDHPASDGPAEEPISPHTTYCRLPHDCGLSAGRNLLVDKVQTPYTMVVDDDFEFIDSTKIEKLLACVEQASLDLVAGWLIIGSHKQGDWRKLGTVEKFAGLFKRDGERLVCEIGQHEEKQVLWMGHKLLCQVVDVVLNFFVARTESLKNVRWDVELKLGEHVDFFLRAQNKVKIGVCGEVIGLHHPNTPPDYLSLRNRLMEYQMMFMRNHGLQSLEFVPALEWF